MYRYKNSLIGATFAIIALIIWKLASEFSGINAYILPDPVTVYHTTISLIKSGELVQNIWISMTRIFWGYSLAIAISALLTLMICSNKILRSLVEPPLNFLRQIPPLALLPLLLAWLGIGEEQKITVIILGCLFPILFNFIGGFEQVDKKLIEVARVLGFSKQKIIMNIVIPSAIPSILIGLRVGLGFSWRSLVGAELIASSSGLGYMMVDAESMARTDIIIVGVILIGTLGMFSDYLLGKLITLLSPWHHQTLSEAKFSQ